MGTKFSADANRKHRSDTNFISPFATRDSFPAVHSRRNLEVDSSVSRFSFYFFKTIVPIEKGPDHPEPPVALVLDPV